MTTRSDWTVTQDDYMVDVEIGHGLTMDLTVSGDGRYAFHGFSMDGHHGVGITSDQVIDGVVMPEGEFTQWLDGKLGPS